MAISLYSIHGNKNVFRTRIKFRLLECLYACGKNGRENVHMTNILRVFTAMKSGNAKYVRVRATSLGFLAFTRPTFLTRV